MKTTSLIERGLKPRWVKRATYIDKTKDDGPRPSMDKVLAYNGYTPREAHRDAIESIEMADYEYVALHEECLAILSALEGRSTWAEELAFTLRYYLFYHRLDYFWHTQSGHFHNGRGLHSIGFERVVNSMAYAFMLGWTEAAIYQGYLCYAVLNQSFQPISYGPERKHAHTFMLRLFADWRGHDVSHPFLDWAYEVPLYEGLLQNWRESDPAAITPWLHAACEYHAHHAKQDTSRTFFDFGDFRIMRMPLEIHMILRLRELSGLANPTIEHELMLSPFEHLLPEQAVLPKDELMQGTLKRVCEEWPNFNEVTSLDSLKAVPAKQWRYTEIEARNLLGL